MTRFKIVNGGHVNLPAEVAARWSTRFVELEDHDDHVVLRPCADEATLKFHSKRFLRRLVCS